MLERKLEDVDDHFIDDHLVEMFSLFDQARLQLVDVTNLAAVHTLPQLPQIS